MARLPDPPSSLSRRLFVWGYPPLAFAFAALAASPWIRILKVTVWNDSPFRLVRPTAGMMAVTFVLLLVLAWHRSRVLARYSILGLTVGAIVFPVVMILLGMLGTLVVWPLMQSAAASSPTLSVMTRWLMSVGLALFTLGPCMLLTSAYGLGRVRDENEQG